jgi:hypothetical protein
MDRDVLAQKKLFYEKLGDEQKAALEEQGKATQLGGRRAKSLVLTAEHTRKSAEVRSETARRRAIDLAPVIADLQRQGVTSLGTLARALSETRIPTARDKAEWTPMQVSRALTRLGS